MLLLANSGWDEAKVLLTPKTHVGVQDILAGETVRLTGMKLRKDDFKLVLAAVRTNSKLRTLELASCSIGPGSAVHLVEAIIESRCPVVTLDLSFNKFFKEADAREEKIDRLARKGKGASSKAALEALAVRSKGFLALMRLIREAPALKALRIRRIGLRVQDAVVLAQALREDAGRIEVLDVSDNHKLGSVGAALIAAALSRPYSQLTALSLRYCGLGCGRITEGPQLELVPMAWEAIRGAALGAGKTFSPATSPRTSITGSALPSADATPGAGARAIAVRSRRASSAEVHAALAVATLHTSLTRRQRMKKATLQKMADGSARTEEKRQESLGVGVSALSQMLLTNQRLQRLNLSRNELGCTGASAIASAIRTSKVGVTALDLSSNRIAARGLAAIASALQVERCPLRALDLSANPLTATVYAMGDARARRRSAGETASKREHDSWTAAGLTALGHALVNNNALASLSLAQTGIVPREVERKAHVTDDEWTAALEGVRAIAFGLRGNGALLALDLRRNGRCMAQPSGEARRVLERALRVDGGGEHSAVDSAELINAKVLETIAAVQGRMPECVSLGAMTVRWLQTDVTQMVFGFLARKREVLF